jgi:hypothetical protein
VRGGLAGDVAHGVGLHRGGPAVARRVPRRAPQVVVDARPRRGRRRHARNLRL